MTGTPTPDPFPDRQLRVLERIVSRLVSQQLGQRLAAAELHRDIRLAKTVQASGSYPASGDTFWIRFLDASFSPAAAGSTTLTEYERTAEGDTDDAADCLAREVNGLYLPVGTLVFALWQRPATGTGEWWIFAGGQKKPKCRFTASAELTTSDPYVSGTISDEYNLDVGSDQWGHGAPHTTLTGTFYNLLTHSAGVYEFYMDSGDAGIASYSGFGTTWFIDIPECP